MSERSTSRDIRKTTITSVNSNATVVPRPSIGSEFDKFVGDYCLTDDCCRDLLNRHVSLTHSSGTSAESAEGQVVQADSLDTQVEAELQPHLFPPEEGIWPPAPSTNPLLCDAIHRTALEDVYFQYFHPHWPILHQHAYRNTRQPPDLVRCVLIAGLCMSGAHREEVKKQHECLVRCLGRELVIYPLNLLSIHIATKLTCR
jgi:hypothetical protein